MFVAALFLASLFVLAGAAPAVLRAQQPEPPPPPRTGHNFGFTADFGSGAWLGVNLKDVTAEQARTMKLPGEYGAIVTQVEPGSPAAKAGFKVNDVILEFGGMRVWSAAQLAQLVRQTPPGRTVTLRISRSGEKLNLQASLASRNEHAAMPRFVTPRIHINPRTFDFHFAPFGPRLGIQGETLTAQLASYFGVKQGKGVLVAEVDKGSPADKAGLKAGDCIVKAGSDPVNSIFDLTNALAGAKGSQVTLSIVRAKQEQTLTATLDRDWRPMHEFRGEVMGPRAEMQLRTIEMQLPQMQDMQKQIEGMGPKIELRLRGMENQLPQMEEMQKQIEKQAPLIQQRAQQLEQRIQLLQRVTSTGEV